MDGQVFEIGRNKGGADCYVFGHKVEARVGSLLDKQFFRGVGEHPVEMPPWLFEQISEYRMPLGEGPMRVRLKLFVEVVDDG